MQKNQLINENLDGMTFAPTTDFLGEAALFISADEAESELVQTAYCSVKIVVGGAVVALDDEAETILDEAVTVAPLANDTSSAEGAMTIAIVTGPTHGTAVVNEDNTVTYTPDEDYYGTDSFTYEVTDADTNTDTATIRANKGVRNL